MSNDGEAHKVSAAMKTLALLNAQADAVRTDLANLRREFVTLGLDPHRHVVGEDVPEFRQAFPVVHRVDHAVGE